MKVVLATCFCVFLYGCEVPVFGVEVEAPLVCVEGVGTEIPGTTEPEVVQTLADDFLDMDLSESLKAELRVLEVSIHVDETQLEQLSQLQMLVVADTLPQAAIVQGDNVVASDQVFTLFAEEPINLAEYMASSGMSLQLGLAGALPSENWPVTIDMCFSGQVRYVENL